MKNIHGNIAILGSGNIGLSLAYGLVKADYQDAASILLTRRNVSHLTEQAQMGYQVSANNPEAVKNASIVILAVLPQQLDGLLHEIQPVIDASKHLVISVISGVSCKDIKAKLGHDVQVVRVMPNTAISIGQSMTCIASDNASTEQVALVQSMFETVGSVVVINEDLMTSATALCACGIAFFLRAIRAASQGGVEIGFHADIALKMAVQTAKGAADLLLQHHSHPEQEIDKVTSPKGCTIAGLNEMEHQGFSSSLIKGIKLSAVKAGELYIESK
ncbi:Pyrroline-5-carboxylate reductase [Arcticibacter svalbardensis MN12-7]|uniref:Pyrroline-5-carboxylate reductase n=1 Tax=Arcticibacter svalbardensis MN12-7 TaxID=1150600 RepID=R9GSN2_9SPHI|nr:pyrroline-5-carboxylate reductase [Arcticibacter svalbardensis]EOR94711.1 Pyrroline-5-carboxylate reductase [Arcticibacter svalbardensis MN12-7]